MATRAELQPIDDDCAGALERLKLEDGDTCPRGHEGRARRLRPQNGRPKVKPFMLVVARTPPTRTQLVQLDRGRLVLRGAIRGKVIQVHSGQKGAEKDENVERLLTVEHPDKPTEIVIHVNMLKEGWDVTNLYTIVPLRAADSRTLVEQSIGRGSAAALRQAHGRARRGPPDDRRARPVPGHRRRGQEGRILLNRINIGEDVPETPKKTVVVAPVVETVLGVTRAAGGPEADFGVSEEIAPAAMILEAVRMASLDVKRVPGPDALQSAEVREQLVAAVKETVTSGQLSMYPVLEDREIGSAVDDTVAAYVAHTIAIPSIIVLPTGMVSAGFADFVLDVSSWDFKPVSEKILVQHLSKAKTRVEIATTEGGHAEQRLEDYVVRGLIEFSDVSYDDHAELLYDLAGQVVTHLRSDLKDEGRNSKCPAIPSAANFESRSYADAVTRSRGGHRLQSSSQPWLLKSRHAGVRSTCNGVGTGFRHSVKKKSDIPKMLFGAFNKCLYSIQKFQSDPERRFAAVLENDSTVLKWFKPGKGVFQIGYSGDSDYEPDFVVETETEKLLCEPKRADEMKDSIVLAKAAAAATWCEHATGHEIEHGGKPWRYLLIPHDVINDSATLVGLAKRYTFVAPRDDV